MKEILLVEDCDTDAAEIRQALDQLEIANPLRRFTNGEDALAYLDQAVRAAAAIGPPPLALIIFIDLTLPGMSGLHVLEVISGSRGFGRTLCIALTDVTDIQTIQSAYSLGARSFLIKPVQPDDIRELVETYPGYWAFTAQMVSPF
jgi:CheY-like chemotaxis protein